MTKRISTWLIRLAITFILAIASIAQAEAKFEAIRFDDLATSLPMEMKWCWHSIGIDPDDNVYAVFGGPRGDLSDCALIQYKARTGERRIVGLLSDAAKKAGTYREGERVEKGHTYLPWLNGKLYIGTMGFHDANKNSPKQMEIAAKSHGAHLMSYDPKADVIEDLSASEPDGVFFPQRGFLCLNVWPEEQLIAGVSVPGGDLLLYDPQEKKPRLKLKGDPEKFGLPVTRDVIPAPNGKVYWMYSSADWSTGKGSMYVYDLKTEKRSGPIDIDPFYWNGSVRTKDGRIFITTDPGYLYELHYDTDRVERVGSLWPEADQREVLDEDGEHVFQKPHALGMVLSADEKGIYAVPLRKRILKAEAHPKTKGVQDPRGPQTPFGLFRYDIATRTCKRVAEVPKEIGDGYLVGSNVRDSQGNIYFARFGGAYRGFLKINPGE